MPTPKIEEFKIFGAVYSIEDTQASKRAFPHKGGRYKCWWNGCGLCNGHDTTGECYRHIHKDVLDRFKKELTAVDIRQAMLKDALLQLAAGPQTLLKFK